PCRGLLAQHRARGAAARHHEPGGSGFRCFAGASIGEERAEAGCRLSTLGGGTEDGAPRRVASRRFIAGGEGFSRCAARGGRSSCRTKEEALGEAQGDLQGALKSGFSMSMSMSTRA